MKVLMLSWEYPPRVVGGIARVVKELSEKLQLEGQDVTVVTYKEGDTPYFEVEETGVKVYRVDNYMIRPNNFIDWIMQLNFNLITEVNKLIQSGETFDVIHAHDWLTAYAAKTLKESYNIPLVSTIHATEAGRNGGIQTEMQRYINDTEWMLTYESSEVIVNSSFMKNDIQRIFGLPFEKIKVIPNGIDLKKFDGIKKDYEFRRRFAADNEKIILSLGRLVFEKGIQHLIYAMPKILSNYNDAKLVIVGKGGMIDELKQITVNLGIQDKVYFTGYMAGNDVQKMYKVSDVAVFPSTYEPFGIVALEAMLGGTPTVVSDIGGLNEIVKHGETGLKSYAGNANSIADSVTQLLYDYDLSEKITKNAKLEVVQNFNWTKIAEDTRKLYEKAIISKKERMEVLNKKQEDSKKIITEEEINQKEEETTITKLLNFNERKKLYI